MKKWKLVLIVLTGIVAVAAGYAIHVLVNDYQYKRKWRERHERDT